jgi:tetratricopeptide (TPR) repeat protein
MNETVLTLAATTSSARANVLAVRIIHGTVLGSLDTARECALDLIGLERAAGSIRGLALALRFAPYPLRALGRFDEAIAAASEAFELADAHRLMGELVSAADAILTIHLEREDLASALTWIHRCEAITPQVATRYPQTGFAINQAIYWLLVGEPSKARSSIEQFSRGHRSDPLVRQRMLILSILTRIAVAQDDLRGLEDLLPRLKIALDLRRSTGAHDFHVGSYALALRRIGSEREASEYVEGFLSTGRRNRTPVSDDLLCFLRPGGADTQATNR